MNNNLGKLPDIELWRSFRSGDKHALRYIYFRHYGALSNYGKKVTSSHEIAEDCIQELFLKLWKNRHNLGDVQVIKSYLFTAYRRILFELVKVNRKTTSFTDLPYEYDIALSVEEKTIDLEHRHQLSVELKQAIKKLSKRQKEILYLCFYQGFTYKEIEAITSIKNQTIRNCVYEAIKALRKHFQKSSLR